MKSVSVGKDDYNSPWENGYVESFNSKLRDELLDRELFLHIDELRYVENRWRMDYNHYRPHSSLDYMAPVTICIEQGISRDSYALIIRPQSEGSPVYLPFVERR